MNALERVYGYTGAAGTVQGLAAGYFLWDLIVCSRHIKVFGPGLWAHAVCALVVFSFGFVSRSPATMVVQALRWLTFTPPETFLQLLRCYIHPLRVVIAVSQCALVLR